MRWLPLLLVFSIGHLAAAQDIGPTTTPPATPAPAPAVAAAAPPTPMQLSPQAAYDDAKRPLDITRAPYENWSEVEQNALAVSIKQAGESCKARDPYQFKGEDLIAYARLCFFGEDWQRVQLAASNYILAQQAAAPADKVTGFPNLATAFDYSVQALLHLSDPGSAKATAETMLRAVPYDDLVSEATSLTARYLQFAGSEEDALALLAAREPVVLGLLRAQSVLSASTPPDALPALSPHSTLPIHALYADALALPALQQYVDRAAAAGTAFAEAEAALPARLSPDDVLLTAQSRRQYLLLGSAFPKLTPYAWLLSPTFAVPADLAGTRGAATIFLLFPDWCGCVGMGSEFPPAAQRLQKKGVQFYALLAQAAAPPPPGKASPKATKAAAAAPTAARAIDPAPAIPKPTAAEYLAGTPTLVVPNETLNTFLAADYPLIIVTDHGGIIRAVQTAPQNALRPDYLVDQLADHVLKYWPPPAPK